MTAHPPFSPDNPHPFARFVAILGRGKTKQRPLTRDEAREAMSMILNGDALPEQIGAFLMLLRLKEETPDEIAGFALGARDTFSRPRDVPQVDLDWSSYAGKRTHLPWFILSVLALVQSGVRVVVHGGEEHTPGRLYTRHVFAQFGLPIAGSLDEAAQQIDTRGLSYVPLGVLSPVLAELIALKPVLGLRSPVNSFVRHLNPFDAPSAIRSAFHRGFLDIHSGAARILDVPRATVFRGDSGEAEVRPNKPCPVWTTHGATEPEVETWPATVDDRPAPAQAALDPARLGAVWAGTARDSYGEGAVLATMAVALKTMGHAATIPAARARADEIWAARDKMALSTR